MGHKEIMGELSDQNGQPLPDWYTSYARQQARILAGQEDNDPDNMVKGWPPFGTMPYSRLASRNPGDVAPRALTRDVAFNRHSLNDGSHVSPLDNNQVQVGLDNIEVRMVQGLDEEKFKEVLSYATRATTGMNLRESEPLDDSWEEMMRGGLQSALETQTVVFAVSGVSRACTHQLVRSRRAGFHQQSQRATFYGVSPEARMPESVWRNHNARRAYLVALDAAHEAYRIACEEDISYQDARYILPESTTNYILCEYTVREFIAVYAYRACSMFNWEIVGVVRQMAALLTGAHPFLEPYIKIGCELTKGAKDGTMSTKALGMAGADKYDHTCTFQGWEKVEGQCDFPWARDTNRTFRSDRFEIGKDKS